jgi:DNA-directed RNA polymerase specialized sigma24 family protein
MTASLTPETFSLLLLRLDPDQEQAAEKYEELRRKLIRFFEWRGAPFPEEHADEVFDRLAKRIAEGVSVQNVASYGYEIGRLVLLEALKTSDKRRGSLEDMNVDMAVETNDEASDKEIRFACLDDCLRTLPENGCALIVEYYQDERRDRIERRKALATRLGLQREALANRAQRLRDKLERCVTQCITKKLAT